MLAIPKDFIEEVHLNMALCKEAMAEQVMVM